MYRFFSYLFFYFSATNQHGVHSPFVYDYVTQCLYKRKRLRLPVTLKILLKSISYFEYRTIRLLGVTLDLTEQIKTLCPNVTFTQHKADVIFAPIDSLNFIDLEPDLLQNNTLFLVDHIHKTDNSYERWKKLKELDQVRVTLDLFYCGVVFFRKEQVKEHFKIRI